MLLHYIIYLCLSDHLPRAVIECCGNIAVRNDPSPAIKVQQYACATA